MVGCQELEGQAFFCGDGFKLKLCLKEKNDYMVPGPFSISMILLYLFVYVEVSAVIYTNYFNEILSGNDNM